MIALKGRGRNRSSRRRHTTHKLPIQSSCNTCKRPELVQRRCKIKLTVCLNKRNRIRRICFQYINVKPVILMSDHDGISSGHACKILQCCFKDCFRIREFDKVRPMWLNLHKSSFGKIYILQYNN